MLDARFVRDNTDAVRKAMRERAYDWDLDRFTELDDERRKLIMLAERQRTRRNDISKSVGELRTQVRGQGG